MRARSCVGSGSLDLIRRIEAMTTVENLAIPVVRRECFGRCEEEPVMRIAPAGPFHAGIDQQTLSFVIRQPGDFRRQHDA
ncbi:MAG: (2Fe-2S) ferredoxin domain-containing protein [Gammaproteobacteria bacterium]|nr:(2Fe-2S) ferredoxin domain-containing protein [Gammaproteobacteria bacterium]